MVGDLVLSAVNVFGDGVFFNMYFQQKGAVMKKIVLIIMKNLK